MTCDEHRKNRTCAIVRSKHWQATVIVNAQELLSSNARRRSQLYSTVLRYCFYTKVDAKYKKWDLKKTNAENTKQRQHSTRSRTSFNEVQKDSIFLNNQKIESRSIYFIILSWSQNNEKNSNFQIQHERCAMKWKNQRKEIVQNQLHLYLKCKTVHAYIHSRLQNIGGSPILMKDSPRRY